MGETEPGGGNRPLVGVAVIVLREGKVLLGRRKNAHGAGTWALPGGHLEFFESIEDCARREVAEETGIQIGNILPFAFTNDLFGEEKKHYVTLFVTAEHQSGEAVIREPEKCEAWKWFFWADLPKPRFLPLENLLSRGAAPPAVRRRAES
jgi:8-oxo-dGTP diphosphatase